MRTKIYTDGQQAALQLGEREDKMPSSGGGREGSMNVAKLKLLLKEIEEERSSC